MELASLCYKETNWLFVVCLRCLAVLGDRSVVLSERLTDVQAAVQAA
jgi:hypothetical protein